jgi:hypothetical protein
MKITIQFLLAGQSQTESRQLQNYYYEQPNPSYFPAPPSYEEYSNTYYIISASQQYGTNPHYFDSSVPYYIIQTSFGERGDVSYSITPASYNEIPDTYYSSGSKYNYDERSFIVDNNRNSSTASFYSAKSLCDPGANRFPPQHVVNKKQDGVLQQRQRKPIMEAVREIGMEMLEGASDLGVVEVIKI